MVRKLGMVLVLTFSVGLFYCSEASGQVSQGSRGTVTGTVTDFTGALMPGVTVTATNLETGVNYAAVTTNDLGEYSILYLPIGNYAVRFKAQGFETYERSGISISMGRVVKLDVALRIGSASETVSVRTDATPLDTQSATVGTTLTGSAMTDLPFSVAGGRDISRFAFTTMPTVNGENWNTSVANSLAVSKIVTVDGTDADAGMQGVQNPPGMDAVEEFRVEVSGISAESAGTGGGAFMYQMKSGTNQFHGSAFGFLANEALDANTWDNNYWLSYCKQPGNASSGQCAGNYRRAQDRFYDFGFSAGGPLFLPRIYNGKNKTFLFGAWERYNQTDLRFRQDSTTVPTNAMLGGDFSALLDKSVSYGQDSAGNTIYRGAIFDPNTQTVFPGNIIPTNRISAQANNVIPLYQKYYQPNNNNVVNNFNSPLTQPPINKTTNLDLKLDHNFSDKNHFSTSFNYSDQPIIGLGDNSGGLWVRGSANPGPLNSAQMEHTITGNVRAIDTYTLSPRLLNVLSMSYNEWWKGESDPSPVDNHALGFTAESGAVANNLPVITFVGANNINETAIGNRYGYVFQYSRWHISDNVSWVKGRHNLKLGGQFIFYNANSNSGAAGLVRYNFSNLTGVPQALANNSQISPYVGFGFANFLLGEVASGSKGTGIGQHGLRKGVNLFVEDQIKVTPRFTLNASLRWDANFPYHEANGRWSEFDLNAVNPTWAPYKGAYRYLSSGSQSFEINNNFHQFGPHIGAAYQVTDKLVARGAWGLFYVPLGLNTWGAMPYMSDFGYVGVDNAPSVAVNMPSFSWDQNIYPGVQVPPVRDPSANQVRVWGPEHIDPNTLSLGWTQNWNVGVQYGFGKNAVLDVSYIGNIGRHLRAGYLDPRNYPTWGEYGPLLRSGHVSNSIYTQTDAQNAGVPWLPWAVTENFIGGGSSGFYPAYAAINPYPQVAAGQGPILFNDSPLGSSAFKAMIVEVHKRRGALVANLNYTFSRATGNVNNASWAGGNMMDNWVVYSGYQDPSAYRSFDNLVSSTDIPHQVKGYLTYELPFGRGKKWLSGVGEALDALVSGWKLGTMVGYQSGFPITAVASSWGGYPGMSSSYANYNSSIPLSRTFKTLNLANLSNPSNLYFNPQAFSDPTYGTLGNQQPVWSSWRGWGYSNEDLSILKEFGIGKDERCHLTLRAEFFDVFNRHHWTNPNTSAVGSPYFGAVTGVYGNRKGQLGVRFQW